MHQGLALPQRLFAIFSVSAGTVLLTMDASIATVALPTIARDLHVESSASVLVVIVYNLVLAMTLLPFAGMGERAGLRKLFCSGLIVYTLAAALCYVANSLAFLIVLRAVQALGAAGALSVSIALVRSIYPAAQLGRGLGLNTVAGVTGAAMAPALGGLILSVTSWHWVFAAGVPLAILSLASSRALPASQLKEHPLDVLGTALCAATFGLVICGLESVTRGYLLVSTAFLLTGALAGFIFIRHELNVRHPVLPVDLLARPDIALSVVAAFSAVLGSTILILSMPFRLHEYGFGSAEIGAVFVPFAVTSGLFSPVSGMLSDRVAPALLGTIGLAAAMLGVLFLSFLPIHPNHFDLAWRMGLCGLGFGLFFSPNARLIVGSAPPDRAAPASSLIATTRMFGQALGSTLLGGLLAIGVGASSVSALIAAGLVLVAGLCSAARLRLVPQSSTVPPPTTD